MNALADILLRQINATGPISIADYMAQCLLHPEHGYYSTRDPFGEAGDFTTAPEISQMFGELLGLCLAQTWLDSGQPKPFTLAEFGPGRGTFMADMLRATQVVPGFLAAARIVLLEASPTLRQKQRQALTGYDVSWIERADELGEAPLYLIANEFFDALPIRQFSRDRDGWREHLITAVDGRLTISLSAPTGQAALQHRLADTGPGDIIEIRPAADAVMQVVSSRIASHAGAAIVVDYGDWRSLGDTFQAVQHHKIVDPLHDPGRSDLTAHVDFEALAASATAVMVTALTRQGDLLNRLGIAARAEALGRNLPGDELTAHNSALRRLTHPQEMGSLFKAMAFYQQGASAPPGFEQ